MVILHAKKSVFSFPPSNQITDEAGQLVEQEEDKTKTPQETGKDTPPPPNVNFSIIANYHRLGCFGL